MLSPDPARIVKELGGHWRGRQGMCRCPAHDDRSPSMHVTVAVDGTVLVKCFAGCPQLSVIGALRDRGLWPEREETGSPSVPQAPVTRFTDRPDEDAAKRIERARSIWQASMCIDGTPAETYLRSRGITVPLPPTLRFHPSLDHPGRRAFPALVGAIQNSVGRVTAVQRVYVRRDGMGKAEVDPAKLGLGPMFDGAVRLGQVAGTLGIAEGIETALSAQQIFAIPTWAVLGCGRLHACPLPEEVHTVILFADPGEAGQRAAEKARDIYRAQGRTVEVETPPEGDWNDHLRSHGRAA